jgi:hypothetical protein
MKFSRTLTLPLSRGEREKMDEMRDDEGNLCPLLAPSARSALFPLPMGEG